MYRKCPNILIVIALLTQVTIAICGVVLVWFSNRKPAIIYINKDLVQWHSRPLSELEKEGINTTEPEPPK